MLTNTQGRIDPDLPGAKPFPDTAGSFSFKYEEDREADEAFEQTSQHVWPGSFKGTLLTNRPKPLF